MRKGLNTSARERERSRKFYSARAGSDAIKEDYLAPKCGKWDNSRVWHNFTPLLSSAKEEAFETCKKKRKHYKVGQERRSVEMEQKWGDGGGRRKKKTGKLPEEHVHGNGREKCPEKGGG